MDDANINYTKELFQSTWNLAFLVAAVLTALILGVVTGMPAWLFLAVAFGAELLVLGTAPRHPRFRRLIRARKAAERHQPFSAKELFRRLSRAGQQRYARLRRLRQEIEGNYRKLSSASQSLLDSHLHKIDDLLDSFLSLLFQKERFENYARETSEDELTRTLAELREDMAGDAERVKQVKERRLHVIERRLARFQNSRENLDVLTAQLETVEDTVRYIHEQSWTLQHPDEITLQLDALLKEIEETRTSVQEIEEVFAPARGTLPTDAQELDHRGEKIPRQRSEH